MSNVEPTISGPKKPQEKILLSNVKEKTENIISKLNIVLITGKVADDIHTSLKNIKNNQFPIVVDKQMADDLVSKRVTSGIPPPPSGMYS